jgi:hypothetical protein
MSVGSSKHTANQNQGDQYGNHEPVVRHAMRPQATAPTRPMCRLNMRRSISDCYALCMYIRTGRVVIAYLDFCGSSHGRQTTSNRYGRAAVIH